jgi:crossover junction endodeoxyribonuclease RuvC
LAKKAFLPARVLAAAGLSPASIASADRTRRSSRSALAIARLPDRRDALAIARRPDRRSAPSIARRSLAAGTVVLGLDPGTILVGYGVVEVGSRAPRFVDAGVLRARRKAAVPERLGEIQREVALLLERFRPAVVVVERAFAGRNVLSALRIGEGRGIILACAASFGAEVVEMPPASAKKAVVGHGGASKVQVAKMAAAALGLREAPRPLDASDALALALAHVGTRLGVLSHGRSARAG